MDIKLELLKDHIYYYISSRLDDFAIDVDKIADSKAISLLEEIKQLLQNSEYSDFEAIEEIVALLESNGIDCGDRHDF